MGVLLDRPLPNPSGITGVMLCMYVSFETTKYTIQLHQPENQKEIVCQLSQTTCPINLGFPSKYAAEIPGTYTNNQDHSRLEQRAIFNSLGTLHPNVRARQVYRTRVPWLFTFAVDPSRWFQ